MNHDFQNLEKKEHLCILSPLAYRNIRTQLQKNQEMPSKLVDQVKSVFFKEATKRGNKGAAEIPCSGGTVC